MYILNGMQQGFVMVGKQLKCFDVSYSVTYEDVYSHSISTDWHMPFHHTHTLHTHTHTYTHTSGPPAPPQPTMELVNATTLQLTWFPPFTWTNFPIQNYTVRMENTSNSMNNRQWNILANENNSDNNVSFELSTMNGKIARECALLNFSVTAWSDLGESR